MDQYHCSAERWLNDKSVEQGSVIDGGCDNLFRRMEAGHE